MDHPQLSHTFVATPHARLKRPLKCIYRTVYLPHPSDSQQQKWSWVTVEQNKKAKQRHLPRRHHNIVWYLHFDIHMSLSPCVRRHWVTVSGAFATYNMCFAIRRCSFSHWVGYKTTMQRRRWARAYFNAVGNLYAAAAGAAKLVVTFAHHHLNTCCQWVNLLHLLTHICKMYDVKPPSPSPTSPHFPPDPAHTTTIRHWSLL